MDIVHHSVIGLIGLTVCETLDRSTAGVFFLIGSVFPDLDVILMLFGKRVYLKNHQGFTHSMLLSPLFSLILVALFIPFIPFSWINFSAVLLGLLVHVLLDYSNTYGISLLYPLSKKRFSLDSVFFIDTFLLILSISMLLLHYSLNIYLSVFLSYVAFKIILQKSLQKKLHADFSIPSAFNPFDFYIYQNQNGKIITYQYNVLSRQGRNHETLDNIDEQYRHLLNKSKIFNDVNQVTKALHVTQADLTSETTTITAKDMALRNFGGKFATTTLVFDKKGELLSEKANI